MQNQRNTDVLLSIRRAVKLYEQYLEEARKGYHLSRVEIAIIGFLHNNPGRDTARDIVELRMLPKGNVSQGVEALIQKRLLERIRDGKDRRRVHLSLRPDALPVIQEIEKANDRFRAQVFSGFSKEEYKIYMRLVECIMQNILAGLRGEDRI